MSKTFFFFGISAREDVSSRFGSISPNFDEFIKTKGFFTKTVSNQVAWGSCQGPGEALGPGSGRKSDLWKLEKYILKNHFKKLIFAIYSLCVFLALCLSTSGPGFGISKACSWSRSVAGKRLALTATPANSVSTTRKYILSYVIFVEFGCLSDLLQDTYNKIKNSFFVIHGTLDLWSNLPEFLISNLLTANCALSVSPGFLFGLIADTITEELKSFQFCEQKNEICSKLVFWPKLPKLFPTLNLLLLEYVSLVKLNVPFSLIRPVNPRKLISKQTYVIFISLGVRRGLLETTYFELETLGGVFRNFEQCAKLLKTAYFNTNKSEQYWDVVAFQTNREDCYNRFLIKIKKKLILFKLACLEMDEDENENVILPVEGVSQEDGNNSSSSTDFCENSMLEVSNDSAPPPPPGLD